MYGIFAYIWLIFMVNVGKYNIPYMDPQGLVVWGPAVWIPIGSPDERDWESLERVKFLWDIPIRIPKHRLKPPILGEKQHLSKNLKKDKKNITSYQVVPTNQNQTVMYRQHPCCFHQFFQNKSGHFGRTKLTPTSKNFISEMPT